MPLVNKTFNQLIDFTRTSAATYVDATGKIVPTPASRNLLTFTQEFDNAAWVKTAATALPFDPATASYGPELITNGDFSGGTTGWTGSGSGGWLISGGVATHTAGTYGTLLTSYASTTTPGKVYVLTFDFAGTGGLNIYSRNALLGVVSGTGAKRIFFTAAATSGATLNFEDVAFNGTIDNISLKEVIGGLIAAPDGTLTADMLVENTAAGVHYVSETVTGTSVGATYTASVYAKPNGRNWIILEMSGATIYASFNVATGAVGTTLGSPTATITPVGNGWYRCSMTKAIGAGISAIRVYTASADNTTSYTGDGTSGIYLWGAQLEAGSTATDYTRNNGGVYPPRFDYDPVTLAPKGLLVEEQRTNLLTYSEQFDNAAWGKGGATVTANAVTSPDGTVDADKLVEDTANSGHGLALSYAVVSATTYALSFYAKAAGRSRISFSGGGFAAQGFNAIFDVSNGTMVLNNGDKATITAVGNGWYRCTVAFTTSSTVSFGLAMADNSNNTTYTGDGTSGLYIWGAQLEAGAFATSYIPTVASQVTRTADVATITGANFSQWYNQSEGTFVVEADVLSVANTNDSNLIALYTGTFTAMRQWIWSGAPTTPRMTVLANGGSQAELAAASGIAANATFKIAGAYKTNDFSASFNGATPVTDTSGTVPTGFSQLNIGSYTGFIGFMSGHIRSIRYYPTRLSNAQLQALTA